jgi:probable selenium-dependent hydroxylase accessory protein YqeC
MATSEGNASLLRALGAERGVVCAIGAGGKKTTLYRLLQAHAGRVGLTATAFTADFPAELGAQTIIAPAQELLTQVPAAAGPRVAYAQPSDKPSRVAGLDAGTITRIHADGCFELTLVKADGARMRRIKCPQAHEPSIPACTDTVLLVLSALAIGKPLTDKVAHRPERVAAVTGLALGEPIRPADLAAIFSRQHGLLQGTEGYRVIPVLNMVDDAALEAAAREVAHQTLTACARFDRVVLTSNRRADYLVDVIAR